MLYVKAGALAIVIYIDHDGQIWVLTQIRIDPDHPLYDGLIEIVAETKRIDESILATVERGIEEEIGSEAGQIQILGANGRTAFIQVYQSNKSYGQEITLPYCGFDSIDGNGNVQLIGHCFIAVLPKKYSATANKEAKCHIWWRAADLLILARDHPDCFSFTYGFMRRVLEDIDTAKLMIEKI